MNTRPVTRPVRKSEIELFANYSNADLLALEMDLDHVPEGELPVTMDTKAEVPTLAPLEVIE